MEAVELKPYTFRSYELTDIPFIQSSWGNSYYEGVNGHKLLEGQDFHKHHRPIREAILNKPNIAIIVCASTEDPDLIIGYIIVEKPESSDYSVLHYVYVKQAFKRQGIARELFKRSITKKPVMYTHETITAGRVFTKFKVKNRECLDRYFHAPHLL